MSISIPDQLEQARTERSEIEKRMSDPGVATSPEYRELTQRHAWLRDLIEVGEDWERVQSSVIEEEEMLETEDDLREELEAALTEDRARLEELDTKFKRFLVPPDPSDLKTAIVEIRAGTGGDESTLFAADLLRMYSRYAEKYKMKIGLLDSHPTPLGGFRQLIFTVEGKGAYGVFRYESGVHRVQRVPETESQGLSLIHI